MTLAHTYSDQSREAQAKAAWDLGLYLLKDAGMGDKQARMFFGKLLSKNHLHGADMLQATMACKRAGTGDPVGYLTRAAASQRTTLEQPSLFVSWT